MGDDIDRAAELTDKYNKEALEVHTELSSPDKEFSEDEGIVECDECGVDIPTSRRRATGSLLCVDCQGWFEASNARKIRKESY